MTTHEAWDFEIYWANREGRRLVVTGELDAHTVEALVGMLRPAAAEGRALEVDLARLRFVDGSAARALARLWQAWNGRLRLVGVSDRVRRVFRLLELESVLAPAEPAAC